ncbi:hypothetical protein A2765_04415 [Candidatus Kaiserbacteria bacterium RIFCSPHIGHO2_01_FULL_56_24]|uniref:Uncharacterized protein n=1 Tax=Candidatus Kaiserbacteria bacterium RIFCSPHIGHO2_01_FULL_56_24 TaxID=1798487 RepID=A0A1F6DFK8_9BACT|nr:MAG: hypothetical protein A2765_04415 [Candidatus Kaiserbacteria bacterium RIFCSPHIGHO2_01_FULL_56_24]
MSPRLYMLSCIAAMAIHGDSARMPSATIVPRPQAEMFPGVEPGILKMLEEFRNKQCPAGEKDLQLLEKKTSCC